MRVPYTRLKTYPMLSALTLILLAACNGTGGAKTSSGTATGSEPSSATSALVPETAPTVLNYASSSTTYPVGTTIQPNSPSPVGGIPTLYEITPDLPDGLILNARSGVISGTPSTSSPGIWYSITASNSAGFATVYIRITILPEAGASGSFTLTSLMIEPRLESLATLLPDGKVLIVGGYNYAQGYLATSEIFDPLSGTFTEGPSMQSLIGGDSLLEMSDGKIIILGGREPVNGWKITRTEIFDSSTMGFISGQPTAIDRRGGQSSTVLADNSILVVGGNGDDCTWGATLLPSIEIGFLPGPRWSAGRNLNTPSSNHSAVRLSDGRVLVTGGDTCAFSALFGWLHRSTRLARIYDPTTGFWTNLLPMNAERSNHRSLLLSDGKVLIMGGAFAWDTAPELFDPSTEEFTRIPGMPYGYIRQMVELNDRRVLLITEQDAVLLHPATGTYSFTGSMNLWRGTIFAIKLRDGKVLVGGGSADGSAQQAEIYTP